MAAPQNTSYLVAGALNQGFRYAAVTTAGTTFETSLPLLVTRVVFTPTDASTNTIQINAEGQGLNGGSAMLIAGLICDQNGFALAANCPIVWEPDRPIKWNAGLPLKFVPNANCGVTIHSIPDPNP